jgi:hypothetical protein
MKLIRYHELIFEKAHPAKNKSILDFTSKTAASEHFARRHVKCALILTWYIIQIIVSGGIIHEKNSTSFHSKSSNKNQEKYVLKVKLKKIQEVV